MMAAWKLGPALACGNTVVLKAAEQTPLSVLYLAKLIKEAGFPAGVVNIVNGYGAEAGSAIAAHPGVDKIAFTGSTITGKAIMKKASEHLKNVTLETGGKSPLIVFDDADFEQAVKWSHGGIMALGNMGQICTATSRIFVQDTIYEKFLEAFHEQVKSATVIGDPFDENTTHGPQVSKAQYEKILSLIEAGKSEGAGLLTGGARSGDKGFYIQPTVFRDVKPNMKIAREEIFGPCVIIAPFSTEADAIKSANDTSYGLGAAVFTENLRKAHRVAAGVQAGTVWINSSRDTHYGVPFGGSKQSGIGRELGSYALSAYTQVKAVHGTFFLSPFYDTPTVSNLS
ncbi:aldehyde dehydrogenase [Fusarium subglutinans]|uniref:Aldehyde dehydrogenase n=1 Tax=Gibberella subglutinans TaxID=42677 RepID=A0A8H5NRH9_GIBSU|nr:aldehyde dehydrogenase [Fusarium subglutinans]KAF5573445.1 aldehyde dehydrogenase [Fusarium subglutinans]